MRRINKLVFLWPDMFNINTPIPLARGILEGLIEDASKRKIDISRNELRIALLSYTKRFRYLRVLISGGYRYGIAKVPQGIVSTLERKSAAITLDHMRQNMLKRKHNEHCVHKKEMAMYANDVLN
ncbi:TPA: prop effector [Escherichia coli]|nr:prop effector [Escherichia coli]